MVLTLSYIKWKYYYRCGEVTDVYNTGKGYAFVTMVDEDAAQAAMRELNGTSIDGQPIKVGIDTDMTDSKAVIALGLDISSFSFEG